MRLSPYWIIIGLVVCALIGAYLPGSYYWELYCMERPWLDTRPPC